MCMSASFVRPVFSSFFFIWLQPLFSATLALVATTTISICSIVVSRIHVFFHYSLRFSSSCRFFSFLFDFVVVVVVVGMYVCVCVWFFFSSAASVALTASINMNMAANNREICFNILLYANSVIHS